MQRECDGICDVRWHKWVRNSSTHRRRRDNRAKQDSRALCPEKRDKMVATPYFTPASASPVISTPHGRSILHVTVAHRGESHGQWHWPAHAVHSFTILPRICRWQIDLRNDFKLNFPNTIRGFQGVPQTINLGWFIFIMVNTISWEFSKPNNHF